MQIYFSQILNKEEHRQVGPKMVLIFIFKMEQELEFREKMKKKDYKIEEHMKYLNFQKQNKMIEESKQTENDEIDNNANQELL